MLWNEWLSLFLRWFHVIAGVAWIGASFYFIWLDNNLKSPPDWKKEKGIKGDLWAVHGGGFYEVAKYQYGPDKIPQPLHWFKWEAYSTWISGFLLLVLVYYFGASFYLIDPQVKALTPTEAVSLGLCLIFGSLLVYEIACRSPLANYPKLFALFLVALLSVTTWLACQWFSGRGAYIHVGAIIGTIMAGNVFFKIIPSQKLMVDAVANKLPIDPAWGEGAKLRSVHNNYLTLPLLFIMISNHYPITYQHEHNWLLLIAICGISAWIRHYFNLKHQGDHQPMVLISGCVAMLFLALIVSTPTPQVSDINHNAEPVKNQPEIALEPLQQQAFDIIQTHCANCHSVNPTDEMFVVAPMGVVFDSWQQISMQGPRVMQRTVITKDMPFLNKTKMTDQERQIIARWYEAEK